MAAALIILAGALARADAAGARLFGYSGQMAMVCEVDPTTGVELSSFSVPDGDNAGLAFNGVELFFTNDSLTVTQVYLPDGTLLREIPRSGVGPQAAEGLGVSATSLFAVNGTNNVITAVSPHDGSFQQSFTVPLAHGALTFAGSRGSLFTYMGGSTVGEFSPATQVLRQIAVPTEFDDLAFSSALGRLFGVTHEGVLYGMDPETGAVLPGYPLTITAHGEPVLKTGALAADEAADARCDDGDPCTVDCCADSLAGCSHTSIPNCGLEDCTNCIDDDLDGRTDLEDADCCAEAVSMRAMRSRLLGSKRRASKAQLHLRSAFTMLDFNPLADDVRVQLRGGSELLCAVLPNHQWRKRPLNRFVFRGGNGSRTDGLTGAVIRTRPNHEVRFRMAGAPIDATRYTTPELSLTLGFGTRCSSGTLQLRQQKTKVITYRSR